MRRTNYFLIAVVITLAMPLFITGCSENTDEIGIGPVKSITLGAVDKNLADKGKELFEVKCITCHRFDSKLIGPPLKGVTKRRKPEWIMNMMLNPDQMIKENPTAKQLFTQYMTQMTFQNVTQEDARAILEYFRSLDN
jgi:mono/diheme cytochrome c family protein